MIELSKRLPKTPIIVSLLLLCLSATLLGCKKDPRVVFIQGVWYYKDAHLANIPSESAQVTTWVFENGYVSMDSCCFVKMNFTGYYSVTERAENELTLELFNLQGQAADIVLHRDDTLIAILKIDTEADTLRVNNDGPYTRLNP